MRCEKWKRRIKENEITKNKKILINDGIKFRFETTARKNESNTEQNEMKKGKKRVSVCKIKVYAIIYCVLLSRFLFSCVRSLFPIVNRITSGVFVLVIFC